MIKVISSIDSFNCSKAIKGADYVKLYDSNNTEIAAFIGISDFTEYTIEGGTWSNPEPKTEDYLVDLDYRLSKKELGV